MEDYNFDIEQLIGRRVSLSISDDALNALKGKFVAVTGAAGSIGSEICRQLTYSCETSGLLFIDNAETPLHQLRLELSDKTPENSHFIIADIRDKRRIDRLFAQHHPEIVFHAAAYKHVPFMEENPYEAAFVNVIGTKNVADAAAENGCETFVLASTDKAVEATGILGASKRLAEMYIQSRNSATKFLTVRFGNVTDSNGSVLPLFRQQIKNGGPVTVTDSRMTRYFMTIPEACKLIIEACALGHGNDTFLFDMGEPISIIELARKMIEHSGRNDIKIVETGIRPGENITEKLLNKGETTEKTSHPRIEKIVTRHISAEQADEKINIITNVLESCDDERIGKTIKGLVE